jgi:diguanylate cyclase (GGDEF)-like protein
MRAITGWRFLIVIVLPLTLALLSAIGLIYDLLSNVENSGNLAENARNRNAISEAFAADAQELGRLTAENAFWDEAWQKTTGAVDSRWFHTTWGRTISIGNSYDVAAIIDRETGELLIHNSRADSAAQSAKDLIGINPEDLRRAFLNRGGAKTLAGQSQTQAGPATVAISIIADPANPAIEGRRLLAFVRLITPGYLSALEKRLQVNNLKLETSGGTAGLGLPDAIGAKRLHAIWSDKPIGGMVVHYAWSKVSPVMGFLILVMCGIVLVCWRLLQQLMLSENMAKRDAMQDHLTKLANRNALVDTMKHMSTEDKAGACLAFVDLDGFKEVNDSYGHEYGDRLICMVAAGISRLAQGARLVARMGGDEFVVLFQCDDAVGRARQFSDRLIKMLSQPFDMDGRLALVGASVGLAKGSRQIDDTELMRQADVAMYRAKADGKNRHCLFEEALDNERRETLSIAAELKQILRDDRLDILFQPVVSAKSGLITGVEALARWPASSPRKVTADRFVTVAESSGLIDELGEAILAKACGAARAWPTLRLAVNISAVQLNNPRFVERALAILANHSIAPNRIEFEITETSLIHDAERAKQVFKALQGVGIKVALDDFGTGFSSIGYLRRFNFDRIKIDKSIVSKVLTSPEELAIVQGVLLVARGLSAEVTAEGVEREDEVKVLHLAGCSELQGYHFHHPMQASDVSVLVSQGKAAPSNRVRIVA